MEQKKAEAAWAILDV